MGQMLARGFTTVRDTGGADFGLAQAVEEGLFPGPRLFVSGRPLTQTGGHADFRARTDDTLCACAGALGFQSRIVDGVDMVRHGVRDELRKGATQIKIMASGGVASPNDPLEGVQFAVEEIRAAVEEATNWGTYVCAHAYGAGAIRRAVEAGVRSIEHGNLIDASTAELMAARGAFVVPTLVAYEMLQRRGAELGLGPASLEKLKIVLAAGLGSLEICKAAGVRLGFGSDLLGDLQTEQSLEFRIRGEVETPHEVITAATQTNAALLNRTGELGVVAAGALADLLVVDGDPLRDLELLQGQGRFLAAIMKGGQFFKNALG
jgi:imidazolonepropionase-like amidohydrolase